MQQARTKGVQDQIWLGEKGNLLRTAQETEILSY